LIALMLPALAVARQTALRTQCAANLRQIGYAFEGYANDNTGWIPRDCTLGRPDRAPWMILIARYFGQRGNPTVEELPKVGLLQCPSHPVQDIPCAYVVNAFAFETAPNWAPDGPVKRTAIARSSELPWVLEAADWFDGTDGTGATGEQGMIFGVQFHDCYAADHLPHMAHHRLSDDRHVKGTANVLFLDSHVSVIHRGELRLEMFDDGVRKRATPYPPTN
jgi:prepilin-type processing-associated H-X9-DG protein